MSLGSALELVDSVCSDSVLFVGDTIIDEYHYVTPLGKSAKENLISFEYRSSERFMGGIDAAARHAETFVKHVAIASSRPAVRKTRYVDPGPTTKLFEVQHKEENVARAVVDMRDFDCVVVLDFGHGEVTDTSFQQARHLCVNAQTNSANMGYNLITKYARADYAVVDEPEARLAAADRESPIDEIIERLARGRFAKMVITRGRHGAIGWEAGRIVKRVAFTDAIVDTMGAGDAFFAITAPMSRFGSMEDLLLIGNAAGALKTQIVGHRSSVTKPALVEFLKAHG